MHDFHEHVLPTWIFSSDQYNAFHAWSLESQRLQGVDVYACLYVHVMCLCMHVEHARATTFLHAAADVNDLGACGTHSTYMIGASIKHA